MKLRAFSLHSSGLTSTLWIISQRFEIFQIGFQNGSLLVVLPQNTTILTQIYSTASFEQLHLIKLKVIFITNHVQSIFQHLVTSTATFATLPFLKIMAEIDPSAIISVLVPIYTISSVYNNFSRIHGLDT